MVKRVRGQGGVFAQELERKGAETQTRNSGQVEQRPAQHARAQQQQAGQAQGPPECSVCFGGPGQVCRGCQSLCAPLVSQEGKLKTIIKD